MCWGRAAYDSLVVLVSVYKDLAKGKYLNILNEQIWTLSVVN